MDKSRKKAFDLRLLVALDALLAERNVTRAAVRLNISQPALSSQLSRLRTLFNDPLFLPAQRGILPTARALELQEPLSSALENLRGVVSSQARFVPADAHMTYSIAASDYAHHALLMPAIVGLLSEAPGIKVALRRLEPSLVEREMETGEVDLVVTLPERAPPNAKNRPLLQETFVCIARRGHPAIQGELRVEDIARLRYIIASPGKSDFSGAMDQALTALGLTRDVAVSSAYFSLVPDLVAGTDMIAVVPSRLVRGAHPALQVFPTPISVPGFTVSLAWHERVNAHLAHQWIRQRIVDSVQSERGDSAATATTKV